MLQMGVSRNGGNGVQMMRVRKSIGRNALPAARLAAAAVAAILGGCASTITTPLPNMPRSNVSTAMSQQDRKQAVDDLAKARDTHEQEAERQIENSR